MVLIDMPMPESCYECPLMMWCDPCEGHNNHCVFGWEIDCGYIVYKNWKTKEVKGDYSCGTYTNRHKDCPLREVEDPWLDLQKKLEQWMAEKKIKFYTVDDEYLDTDDLTRGVEG